MKFWVLFLIAVLFLLNSCSDADIQDELIIGCPTDEVAQTKENAAALLVGKWEWIKTTYINRASGVYVENSYSSGKQIFFEFTGNKLIITENNVMTEESYEIIVDEVSTALAEQQLKINFTTSTGELREISFLRVSVSGHCLTLINSYNDGGGDLNFQKMN